MQTFNLGDRVLISRDDVRVDEFFAFEGAWADPETALRPYYGNVLKYVSEDKVQVHIDTGEVATFDRYQLELVNEDGDEVEAQPVSLGERISLFVLIAVVISVIYSVMPHVVG